MLARVPFLGRLARRYALRHKGQTVRAILGLLVATTVLATGLGMGESIAYSLERAALAQFGPVDIVLSSQQPFPATVADGLASAAGVEGVRGAGTLVLVGAVSNPDKGLAEAFATIRGVSAQEAATLGPLRAADGGTLPEPGAGEVVLGEDLAERLEVRVGDTVRLRAPQPGTVEGFGLDDLRREETRVTGVAGVPAQGAPSHTFEVTEGAVVVAAQLALRPHAASVTATLTSPSGETFANTTDELVLVVFAPPPVEPGTWTLTVASDLPASYEGAFGAGFLAEDAEASVAVLEARVAGIAEVDGRAAISRRPAALVPLEDLQRAVNATGRATHAYFNVGAADPYAARDALEEALPSGLRDRIEVRAEKADALADAAEAGAEVTGFLLGMGGFTVLAAVLLAFTLFSALVEERRAELGIMRALGLTRGEVALAMTMEGALYAFAAAVVGLLLGLLILAGLLFGISNVSLPRGAPEFLYHVSPFTVLLALGIGVLLPLATIGIASLRFARLDPARAIRGIPDDPKGRRRTGLVMAAALAALGLLLSWGEYTRLAGIPIALAAVAVAVSALGWRKTALLPAAAGFAHIAWSLYAVTRWPEDAGELDPILTLGRGALLALGGAALAVASAAPYEALLRAVGREGAARRSSFIALRYLVSRRRPVGLTMAMIAVVVVVVTVMGTLFAVFGGAIPTDEAGYTVLGQAALRTTDFPRAMPADLDAMVERADFLPRHVEFRQANATRNGADLDVEFGLRQFLGVTDGFAEANEYTLDTRAPQYATDRDAWRAVARGEAILMPAWALEGNGLEAGDRIGLGTTTFGPREYVLAGGVDSQFVFQTFVDDADVVAMGFPTSTQVYLRVAEGADPDTVAHRLTDEYAEDGLTFTSVPEEVARASAQIQALVLVFEAFLALGLFVGLAATGFLAARAVHERMRDIGTLRALGFEERDVRLAFILESTLTSAVGLLIGTLAGLLVAHSVWWREARGDDIPFQPPWLILAVFSAIVLALAAFASRGPAKRAAALPPAIAVRHTE